MVFKILYLSDLPECENCIENCNRNGCPVCPFRTYRPTCVGEMPVTFGGYYELHRRDLPTTDINITVMERQLPIYDVVKDGNPYHTIDERGDIYLHTAPNKYGVTACLVKNHKFTRSMTQGRLERLMKYGIVIE